MNVLRKTSDILEIPQDSQRKDRSATFRVISFGIMSRGNVSTMSYTNLECVSAASQAAVTLLFKQPGDKSSTAKLDCQNIYTRSPAEVPFPTILQKRSAIYRTKPCCTTALCPTNDVSLHLTLLPSRSPSTKIARNSLPTVAITRSKKEQNIYPSKRA